MIWPYTVGAIVVILGASVFFGAPYVPTKRRELQRMLDKLYVLSPKDIVLDIGSGDGVVLREVSRRGAKAVGYEIHPVYWTISRILSWSDKNVVPKLRNAWTTPFPDDVTLVYAFAVERDGKRLARTVQREANRLGRPLMLVCYGSPLAGHRPVRTFEAYTLYRFSPLHPDKA